MYWKAVNIIVNEPDQSNLKSTVVRLGGFHTEMSFLGAIGHLMNESGLSELLETVYASTAVSHMLTGKAIARATRGHFLVHTALTLLLILNTFDIQIGADSMSSTESEQTEDGPTVDILFQIIEVIPEIERMTETFDGIMNGDIPVDSLKNNSMVTDVNKRINAYKETLKDCRTAGLWFQYIEMVELLRQFLTAERTGNWNLHLKSLQQMLPYLAASGRNLYTKSVHVYLQQMQDLPKSHPHIDRLFQSGHHVIRRTDRFWAGLSTDLVIEQVLMRSLKSTGGLTRGRGMTENQRVQWLLSLPQCAETNEAMQKLTDVNYATSDQHKELGHSRKDQDDKDVKTFFDFLLERSPFISDKTLRNIETGTTSDEKVNVDNALNIGLDILKSMENQDVDKFVFKKSKQAVTLGSKGNIKVEGDDVNVNPQLLFQRLVAAANDLFPDMSEIFKYELSNYPSALFEPSGLMRQTQKSLLADTLWNFGDCTPDADVDNPAVENELETLYVMVGGSLIQKIPWNKGSTFIQICQSYVDYVRRRYSKAVVVFDGYQSGPSTKDPTHMRRSRGVEGTKVSFKPNTPFKSKKETFLLNLENKQNLINMLSNQFQQYGYSTKHADADADVLIARTGIEGSQERRTVVIGEDTDILVILLFHCNPDSKELYFRSDKTNRTSVKIWDIKKTKAMLGTEICKILPLIHALSGCDTTSRLYGVGKAATFHKIVENEELRG